MEHNDIHLSPPFILFPIMLLLPASNVGLHHPWLIEIALVIHYCTGSEAGGRLSFVSET